MLYEFGKIVAEGGSGIVVASQAGHMMPPLSDEENQILARTPATELGSVDMLALVMAGTALAGFQRRRILALLAFAAGMPLGCDAWFDVCTASFDDLHASVVSAGMAEIPLSILLIRWAMHLMLSGVLIPGENENQSWFARMDR